MHDARFSGKSRFSKSFGKQDFQNLLENLALYDIKISVDFFQQKFF